MKKPVGACRYCGQEFMSKQGLTLHEERNCLQRSLKAEPAPVGPRQEGAPWIREQEAQTGTRAITGIGAGVKVWRPGHG